MTVPLPCEEDVNEYLLICPDREDLLIANTSKSALSASALLGVPLSKVKLSFCGVMHGSV